MAKAFYSMTKNADGKDVLKFEEPFRKDAVSAAGELRKMFTDKTPLAVNLWTAYKDIVVTRAKVGRLTFFNAIDPTIPLAWGGVGTAEREKINTHPVYNGLCHLVFKIGKTAAGDGPKKRDAKVAAKQLQNAKTTFGTWCKKTKLKPSDVMYLVKNILGLKAKKTGKITKKGELYLKAAGLKVAGEE